MLRTLKRRLPYLVLMTVLSLLLPRQALAQSYLSVQVQPGDTLAKLAGRYCTSWQAIYDINRQTIGPNPNAVEVGLVLTVPATCNSGGGTPNNQPNAVYDRGASTHASGPYNAPYYTVAWGDTIYSITNRFGISEGALRQANYLSGALQPGQVLTIPFAGTRPVQPSRPQPVVTNAERVYFTSGKIGATLVGTLLNGAAKRYVLEARAGQVMEMNLRSHGEALTVSVMAADGRALPISGVNDRIENNMSVALPSTGDYIVTVTPVRLPEGAQLTFDIIFVIQ